MTGKIIEKKGTSTSVSYDVRLQQKSSQSSKDSNNQTVEPIDNLNDNVSIAASQSGQQIDLANGDNLKTKEEVQVDTTNTETTTDVTDAVTNAEENVSKTAEENGVTKEDILEVEDTAVVAKEENVYTNESVDTVDKPECVDENDNIEIKESKKKPIEEEVDRPTKKAKVSNDKTTDDVIEVEG